MPLRKKKGVTQTIIAAKERHRSAMVAKRATQSQEEFDADRDGSRVAMATKRAIQSQRNLMLTGVGVEQPWLPKE